MKKRSFSRTKVFVYSILLILSVLLGHVLKTFYLSHAALHSSSPSLDLLETVDTHGEKGRDNLIKLWQSALLPQQLFAIEKLRKQTYPKKNEEARKQLEQIVLQALGNVDSDIKIYGIRIIENSYPNQLAYLLPLLDDTDPKVRFQALRTFAKKGNVDFTRNLISCLQDSDRENRIMAMSALQRWHKKEDFGARFNANDSVLAEASNKWREWWIQNKDKYKTKIKSQRAVCSEMKAPDFTLPDLDGNSIKMSSSSAPVVMLYFWGKPEHGEVASLKELADLKTVFGNQLTILPIAVDSVAQIDEAHQQENPDNHEKDDGIDDDHKHSNSCNHETASLNQIKDNWHRVGFQELCLLDDGSASFQYISNELPTIVLISNGVIKKRLTGSRSIEDLTAMIQALIMPKKNHIKHQ